MLFFSSNYFVFAQDLGSVFLKLSEAKVKDIDSLIAEVSFFEFPTSPTTVKMVFDIKNSLGQSVYAGENTLSVVGEKIFPKRFISANLPAGKYNLELSIFYDNGLQKIIGQDFEIVESFIKNNQALPAAAALSLALGGDSFAWNLMIITGVALLILAIFFIIKFVLGRVKTNAQ